MAFDVEKIEKSERKIRKFLGKNPKRPSSDAIHNLRTRTRSLETVFNTLNLRPKRKTKRALRELSLIRKRAGRVRDMDVLTADVLHIKHEGDQDCFVQLVEYLGEKRNKSAKKLRRVIKARGSRFLSHLQQSIKRVDKTLQRSASNPSDSDATQMTMAKVIQLSTGLQEPRTLTRKNLHFYRLKVKELRNILQLSDQPGDTAFYEKLGDVKDAIGDWHDWEELLTIARKRLDHGSACRFTREVRETADSKYERALSLTNELRAQYLNRRTAGDERRHSRIAVFRAASAIAK
jgi:CHAD domain-containing protein